jgi:hypothetical protein
MGRGISIMGYNGIRIEREREGYSVTVTDPEIQKANDARTNRGDGPMGSWTDPQVEYSFADKAAVMKFLEKAMDIALPADTYTSAFDKLAKAAGSTGSEVEDDDD